MSPERLLLLPLAAVLFSTLLPAPAHAEAPAAKATVKGTFLGDGKEAKIQYLIAQTREPFSDKSAIKLIFTEKDPSTSKKPDFDAGFKKLGSALIISVFKDGGIFGCEVAHASHEKSPFSAVGEIKMKDFKVTEMQVSGILTTGGELDAFDQKWEVDITFSAPLPKGAFADMEEPAPTKPEKTDKAKDEPTEPDQEPADAGPKLPVEKLPLPAAAKDVEFNQTVQHIAFSSDASVSAVAKDFSAKLKQDGWKEVPGSLMGKTNAILKRKRDGAELTIMVQPAGKGCTVKIFTEGMDWSNPPDSAEPKAKAPKAEKDEEVDVDDVDAEAKRLLNDALKKIPRGLIK